MAEMKDYLVTPPSPPSDSKSFSKASGSTDTKTPPLQPNTLNRDPSAQDEKPLAICEKIPESSGIPRPPSDSQTRAEST
eukprot:632377-Amorphochlora_amoeboformis.AAC.1